MIEQGAEMPRDNSRRDQALPTPIETWNPHSKELRVETSLPLSGSLKDAAISLGTGNVVVRAIDIPVPTLTARLVVPADSETAAHEQIDGKTHFDIYQDEGRVAVRSGKDADTSHVETHASHGGISVSQHAEVVTGTMVGIQIGSGGEIIGGAKSSGARREVELLVPPAQALKYQLETSTGGVKLEGIAGNVDVKTSMGDITLHDVDFRGHSNVETRMGAVDVRVKNDSLGVDVETRMGRISTPAGFRNTGKTAEGNIGSNPDPVDRLRITTSMGNVTVR